MKILKNYLILFAVLSGSFSQSNAVGSAMHALQQTSSGIESVAYNFPIQELPPNALEGIVEHGGGDIIKTNLYLYRHLAAKRLSQINQITVADSEAILLNSLLVLYKFPNLQEIKVSVAHQADIENFAAILANKDSGRLYHDGQFFNDDFNVKINFTLPKGIEAYRLLRSFNLNPISPFVRRLELNRSVVSLASSLMNFEGLESLKIDSFSKQRLPIGLKTLSIFPREGLSCALSSPIPETVETLEIRCGFSCEDDEINVFADKGHIKNLILHNSYFNLDRARGIIRNLPILKTFKISIMQSTISAEDFAQLASEFPAIDFEVLRNEIDRLFLRSFES